MRAAKPENVKRCVYCGAKVCLTGKKKQERTMFHKLGCKPAANYLENEKCYEVEKMYPGIVHGSYVSADVFGS